MLRHLPPRQQQYGVVFGNIELFVMYVDLHNGIGLYFEFVEHFK
jgi:hypothetical protein